MPKVLLRNREGILKPRTVLLLVFDKGVFIVVSQCEFTSDLLSLVIPDCHLDKHSKCSLKGLDKWLRS